MPLFKNLLSLTENNDLTELPEETMKDIQSNIRKGAQDKEQKWSSALELVHKAYQVTNVERPTPNMSAAWKQYEINITYGVEQLSKSRGIDGDWRMSSAALHEALRLKKFKVRLDLPDENPQETFAEAISIDVVVDNIKNQISKDPKISEYDLRVEDENKGVKISFWLHGIRDNSFVKITPTK